MAALNKVVEHNYRRT